MNLSIGQIYMRHPPPICILRIPLFPIYRHPPDSCSVYGGMLDNPPLRRGARSIVHSTSLPEKRPSCDGGKTEYGIEIGNRGEDKGFLLCL